MSGRAEETASVGAERFRRPHERHDLAKVTLRTRAKLVNTVIEPWVDVEADLAAITAGHALRQGDRLVVNGRTYGVKPSGGLYPITGPGFHQLGRGAFRALGVYNMLGATREADIILDRMKVRPEERLAGFKAWKTRGIE